MGYPELKKRKRMINKKKTPSNKQLKQAQVDERDQKIFELQDQDLTQAEIAKQVGVSENTVGRAIENRNDYVRVNWYAWLREKQLEQVKRYDRLFKISLDSFDKSCEEEVTTSESNSISKDGKTKTSKTTRSRTGDPRFLREAREAAGAIDEILNLRKQSDDVGQGETVVVELDETALKAHVVELGPVIQQIEELHGESIELGIGAGEAVSE